MPCDDDSPKLSWNDTIEWCKTYDIILFFVTYTPMSTFQIYRYKTYITYHLSLYWTVWEEISELVVTLLGL